MNLIFIFGDQLSLDISSLAKVNKGNDVIFMCEVQAEAVAVKHHKKKIVFVFSAMRHFADELIREGYNVRYVKIDEADNTQSFEGEIMRVVHEYRPEQLLLTEPSEHRVKEIVRALPRSLDCAVKVLPDDRFLCTPSEFREWAQGRKQFRMEYFYRFLRRKYDVLMDGDKPIGGAWNYDKENRSPAKQGLQIPSPFMITPDEITTDAMASVTDRFKDHFGDIEPFHYAVTRTGALEVLDDFIENRLVNFGTYQDAMLSGEPWMFHSHISLYLNSGLLGPLECVRKAEQAYHLGGAPLNSVEGFIRQILGWREYVKGIYDLKMPDYRSENYLGATRALPEFYWSGKTQMNCLKQCVTETRQNAYAHHIQRLMVLGNFALIAGVHPDEVNEWYHLVYADAYEWVELPNVSGMVLFADGGLLASKPYAASGAYINRMSNYCSSCTYKVSVKNGPKACPFNYLYWNFMIENQENLSANPRMSMPYRTLAKMDEAKKSAIKDDSARFFNKIESGEIA
ncbi:MAG: cryptochrome/photolyase family protein [Maricaulaceae bacterium]